MKLYRKFIITIFLALVPYFVIVGGAQSFDYQQPVKTANRVVKGQTHKTASSKASKNVNKAPKKNAQLSQNSNSTRRFYESEPYVMLDFSQINLAERKLQIKRCAILALPYLELTNSQLSQSLKIEASEEKFRSQLAFAKVRVEKNFVNTLLSIYANSDQFLWSEDGVPTAKARAIETYFLQVDKDGLNPADYYLSPPKLNEKAQDNEKISNFDVMLSDRILRYISDVSKGRVEANLLSRFYDLPRNFVDLYSAIWKIRAAVKPDEALSSFLPQSKPYQELKIALAEITKDEKQQKSILTPENPINARYEGDVKLDYTVSPFLENAATQKVNQPLASNPIAMSPIHGEVLINKRDENFVRDLSSNVNQPKLHSKTITKRVDQKQQQQQRIKLIYALERLRWLPHELPARYVFVNQPAFEAFYISDHNGQFSMPVVIGSPKKQTYFFYDNISSITFNPSWGVPNSIFANEIVPHMQRDHSYLAAHGYVLYNRLGKAITPLSVNWNSPTIARQGLRVRQSPGNRNALGALKILFPNKHDIYLHDTPVKSAFTKKNRALSHGCVRLAEPRKLASALLNISDREMKKYFGKSERNISLKMPVPVYLAYFTAWPNDLTNKIEYFDDVYGRDLELQNALAQIEAARALQ